MVGPLTQPLHAKYLHNKQSSMRIYFFLFLLLAKGITTHAQNTAYIMPVKGLCAHRGGMDTHPENTIPAFKNAIAAGVQMIEFDIQFSKDSALVIMHDGTVDRTTNGSGEVASFTLSQLKQLDAGSKKGAEFKGVTIPTFEETLAVMPKNIWLNCHLKGGEALGKAVALIIQKTGRLHQCTVTGSEEAAAGARQVTPSVIICNADNKYRKDNSAYVNATISMKASFIQLLAIGTPEERRPYIQQLKEHKVFINFYYAPKPEEAKGLWEEGIDFILVNNVPAFLPEMKKQGIAAVKPVFK
jgi:glycerophosphoryl diester phosphodiesterase